MSRPRYVRDSAIMGFAVGFFGLGFGVLSVSSGLSVAQTCAMSLLVFTGASQFAAVSVIGSGGDPVTAVGSGLLLAARNGLYGIALAKHLTGTWLRRSVIAQLVIDESTAMGMAQDDPADIEGGVLAGGISVFIFWNLATLLGAIGGSSIGDPNTFGLDAAFPAAFISLAAPALRHRPGQVAALAGAVIAAVAIPLTRPGMPILLAALGAVIALVIAGPPPAQLALAAEDVDR